ncbi:hypothetical protein CapIbe_021027 [Capra ibex]
MVVGAVLGARTLRSPPPCAALPAYSRGPQSPWCRAWEPRGGGGGFSWLAGQTVPGSAGSPSYNAGRGAGRPACARIFAPLRRRAAARTRRSPENPPRPALLSAVIPGAARAEAFYPTTRELLARVLLKPGEAPPGKARLAIPLPGLAQSRLGAEPRFDQPRRNQSRPARKPKDASPEPGKPQGPGRTAHRADTPERLAVRPVSRIPAALGSASSPGLFPKPANWHVEDAGGGGFGNLAARYSPRELRLLPRISKSTSEGTEASGPSPEEFERSPRRRERSLGVERRLSRIPAAPPPAPAPRRPRKRLRKQSAAVSAQG